MEMTDTIRVMLVDDQQVVVDALKMRLSVEPDLDVVGVAMNAAAAIELAPEVQPDIVLMDVSMGEESGLWAASEIHESLPDTPVIMLTMLDDPPTRMMARMAGAWGFVAKSEPEERLLTAIRQAAGARAGA
jgi:DNA-binding NarL/FixJ family response regulator